jgi:hypothetical protein
MDSGIVAGRLEVYVSLNCTRLFRRLKQVAVTDTPDGERFISFKPLSVPMAELQYVFLNQVDWIRLRSEGRRRHLCLLHDEGLFMIERWRAMRDWRMSGLSDTEKDKYQGFS